MRNKNGGLTSSVVKDRYNTKNYEQVNFRLRKGGYPIRADLEDAAQDAGMSLNAWLVEAVTQKLENANASLIYAIHDITAYARSAGMSDTEYIKQAILEKMERQDLEYKDTVTREKIEDI